MSTTICMILVILAFFGIVTHSIHRDEKRKRERRQQSLPVPTEHREQERRKKTVFSYLAWALQSQWFKFGK